MCVSEYMCIYIYMYMYTRNKLYVIYYTSYSKITNDIPVAKPRYKPGVKYEPISDQRLTAENQTATQEAEEARKSSMDLDGEVAMVSPWENHRKTIGKWC